MKKKYIDRAYLLDTLQMFLNTAKLNILGDIKNLDLFKEIDTDGRPLNKDGNPLTIVEAINEVIDYLFNLVDVTECTFAEWEAVKDTPADPNDKIVATFYRISEAFTFEDKAYQRGSLIYATAIDADDKHEWVVLGSDGAWIGDTEVMPYDDEDGLKKTVAEQIRQLFDEMYHSHVVEALPDLTDPDIEPTVLEDALYILQEEVEDYDFEGNGVGSFTTHYTPYRRVGDEWILIDAYLNYETEAIDFEAEVFI